MTNSRNEIEKALILVLVQLLAGRSLTEKVIVVKKTLLIRVVDLSRFRNIAFDFYDVVTELQMVQQEHFGQCRLANARNTGDDAKVFLGENVQRFNEARILHVVLRVSLD